MTGWVRISIKAKLRSQQHRLSNLRQITNYLLCPKVSRTDVKQNWNEHERCPKPAWLYQSQRKKCDLFYQMSGEGEFSSRLAIPSSLQPGLQWFRWEVGGCTVRRRRSREPLTNADDTALTRRYCFQLNALLRGSQSAEMNKSFHLWKHSAAEQLLPEVKCFHCNVPFQNMKNCWLWPLEIFIRRHTFGCM